MRCLNFLEEKLYLWSSKKSALERVSQSIVLTSVQEGVLKENLLSPRVSPLLSQAKFWKKQGRWGVYFGTSQSLGCGWELVFCAQSAGVVITRDQSVLIGCVPGRIQNHIPLGQCCSPSAREVFKAGLQVLGCANNTLKCSKRRHDEFGWRPKWCSGSLRCHLPTQQACPAVCSI